MAYESDYTKAVLKKYNQKKKKKYESDYTKQVLNRYNQRNDNKTQTESSTRLEKLEEEKKAKELQKKLEEKVKKIEETEKTTQSKPTNNMVRTENLELEAFNVNGAIIPLNKSIAEKTKEVTENTKKAFEKKKQPVKTTRQKRENKDERTWFNTSAFDDGYQIGDISKSILSTVGDLGINIVKGIENTGIGIGKALGSGIADVSDWLGADDFADRIRTNLGKEELFQGDYLINKASDSLDKKSLLGEKSDSLVNSGGQLLTSAALQSVGVPWYVTTGVSSYGEEVSNAFQSGATPEEARLSGLVSAGSEVLFEKISGGIKFGGKTLDDSLKKAVSDKISSKVLSNLVNYGIEATGEGFEELFTEVTSNIGRKLTYEDEKTWNEILASEEAFDNYLEAFMGGMIMSSVSNAPKLSNSINTGRDYNTNLSQNEQKVFNTEVESRINELQKDGKTISNKQRTEIEKQVENDLKRGNISLDTIERTLGGNTYNNYKSSSDRKTFLENKIKELENKKLTETTVKENETLQEYRKELSELDIDSVKNRLSSEVDSLTQSDIYLRESYNNKSRRSQKYTADISKYDTKQQATIQKAIDSGILNDTNQTHDFVDLLAKLSADKGVEFDFTNNENLKNSEFSIKGKTINGYKKGNTIGINIDSSRALNRVVGHEITHILEGSELYTDLQQVVKDYAVTKGEYDTRLNELTELYKNIKDANIENELTADLIGDYLFTDTDFVKNLSTQNRNLFQKIYDEIKYLYKLATAGSKEARQLEKVKRTFDRIYNETESKVTSEDAKLSLMYSENTGNVAVYDGVDFIIDPTKSESWNVKKYFNDNFRGKEIEGVNFDQANKYAYPGKKQANVKTVKNPSITILDDILNSSYNKIHETAKTVNEDGTIKKHSGLDMSGGINRYSVKIGMPNENNVNIYDADFLTRIDKNGKEYFYDIDRIKEAAVRAVDKSKLSAASVDNNIPQNTKNVNDTSSTTKYSIQNNENNTQNSSLSYDNQGRTLTKEQQEYFKNSKIKNESGNLLTVYHGSTNEFAVFDISRSGETDGKRGLGFWFTEKMGGAKQWADELWYGNKPTVYEVYLNITNPKVYENKGQEDSYKQFIKDIAKYDYDSAIKQYKNKLIEQGYDGIVIKNTETDSKEFGGINTQYVVFYPNQIKNIDNTNPTSNEDIRYSLSNLNENIAPVRSDIYGKDIKLQVEEAIAPIKETIDNLSKQVESIGQDIAPVKTAEVVQNGAENVQNIERKTRKNQSGKNNVEFVKLQDIISHKKSGGYRNAESVKNLTNNIISNGIETPIRVKTNGKKIIGIYNGNHRLNIAEKLGLTEVPVVFVDEMGDIVNSREILYNEANKEVLDYERSEQEGSYKDSKGIKKSYDSSRFGIGNSSNNSISSNNRRTTRRNDTLSQTLSGYNDRSSGITTHGRDSGKFKERKWIKTSTSSEVINEKVLPSDLDIEKIIYEPISNARSLEQANRKMDTLGYEESLSYFNKKIFDDKVSLGDIVLGERLIQEAINKKDTKTAGELIENVAILGTELGQKVQALSIIQRMTPEGQLKMLKKIVKRGKVKGDKAFDNVEVTQDMTDKILNTYNEDGGYDQESLDNVMEEVKQEIANQMKVEAIEKVNAWRYLSMLGNPKTHIRNVVSNVAMKGTLTTKNAVARTLETILPIKERTKTWKQASDDVIKYAKKTTLEMKDIISGDSKYNEETNIKSKRKTFKNNVLQKIYDFNSDLLGKEDWWFSKNAFENSFREYLTANGIKTNQDIQNNPQIITKAKNYAVEQAQIATFRQYSWLANKISEIEKKNKATQIAVGSILPFKKTPINIAKTALNYSPLGFAKSLTYDAAQVKKGNMQASTLIDNLSQNITGTALVYAGYLLAKSGFLNGAGDDDKEGKYDYQLGEQSYSINIGGNTYSLSWLSPVAMPLFVGANAYEQLEEGKEWNGDVILETLAQTLDPLSEMSFLSSLDDVLSSYDSGVQKFAGIAKSAFQNYLTQFIPTLSSQVATVIDDKKRTTKVAGDSSFELFDETINKLIYKIPGLRHLLEPSTDIWGNEIKQNENIFERALETFIAPYTRKENIATEIDGEIKIVYNETGDTSVIPNIPYNYVKYGGEKYDMSGKEYTTFKKTYGQTANDLLEDLFKTTTYKNSNSVDKAKMINSVYDYARDEAKKEYLEKENVEYTNATKDDVDYYKENDIKGAIEEDMSLEEYKAYTENPAKYKVSTIIDDYAKYKEYTKDLYDIKADKNSKGKTISGSRKEKVINYINDLDIEYGSKIILLKSEYPSDDRYNYDIIDYLNNRNDVTYDDMKTILEELGFKVKGNNVTWD